MIGADSHKRTHTFVAVDDVDRRLASKTVKTNGDGHLEIVRWSAQFLDVSSAVEDCQCGREFCVDAMPTQAA